MPNIEELISEFNKLINAYYDNNKPFDFSFSYFYKYELFDIEKYIPPDIIYDSHPCLPYCSGTRGLIVDSFGNILDCLVLKPFRVPKPVNIKSLLSNENLSINEFVFALQSMLESKFYDLALMNKEKCLQCRYLNLCKGGCPANAYYISGNLYSADILSCFLFYNFEKYVLPNLSSDDQQIYFKLLDAQKDTKTIENEIELNKEILIKVGGLT